MTLRKLDEGIFVAGQIDPADIAALADGGIAMIVNNRPDGEEPGQPASAEIETAAKTAGIAYRHIPVAGLNGEQIAEMVEALNAADGPVLAFCKSGTRSAYLWALARARQGADGDALAAKAGAAGYDLTPIRRFL